MVEYLLDCGARIGGYLVNIPLHRAITNRNEDIFRLLLDKGAEVDQRSSNGSTPLCVAACSGQETLVFLLLEKGSQRRCLLVSRSDASR